MTFTFSHFVFISSTNKRVRRVTSKVHQWFIVYILIGNTTIPPSATFTRLKQLSANEKPSSFRFGKSVVYPFFIPTIQNHLSRVVAIAPATVEQCKRRQI